MNSAIKFVAQYLIYILVVVTVVWWLRLKSGKKRAAVLLVGSGVLALLLAKVGAYFINDPRPFTEGLQPLFACAADNGFPSDHTLLAATMAFVVMTWSWRKGLVLLTGAVLIGAARVIANVHHISDIIGAVAISAVATLVVYGCMIIIERHHGLVSPNITTR